MRRRSGTIQVRAAPLRVRSEVVSETELHDARSCERFKAGDGSRVAARQVVHGQPAVDVIQCIEILPGESQGLTFGNLERLPQFPVGFEKSRATKRVASDIAFDESVRGIAQHGGNRNVRVWIELKPGRYARVRISDLERLERELRVQRSCRPVDRCERT